MPHKRNPILSERICGMARTVRANTIVGLENIALWHERDISHSSAERIVLPDSSATTDYILAKTTSLLDSLVVYPENMLKNLNLTRGLVFSGQLLLALTQKGVSREDAYAMTQRNAMRVWDEGLDYKDLVMKDADISSHLSREEIARVFDVKHYLRNIDKVFARVFD
jgi:adenylosuccinate lyase